MSQIQRLVRLKRQNAALKIVISVGGWSFQNPGRWSQDRFKNMMKTQQTRAKYIQNVMQFMRANEIDGWDLDWEYPTSEERAGTPEDLETYLAFAREIREAFNGAGQGWTYSIAAPAGFWYLQGFKIGEMSQYLDYIVYMTYDLHGNWDANIKYPGAPGAAVFAHNNLTEISDSIKMIKKAGVDSNKILLGIGFYGRSFKLVDPSCTDAGCPFVEPGPVDTSIDNYRITATPGICTGGPNGEGGGTLAYFEIDWKRRSASKVKEWFDEKAGTTILVYDKNEWVAYEDVQSLKQKLYFAKEQCLGGTIVWAVDQDDAKTTLASTISGVGARPAVDMAVLDGLIAEMEGWETMPDDFMERLKNIVIPNIKDRQLPPKPALQLILNGQAWMLKRLVQVMEARISRAQLKERKPGSDKDLMSFLVSEEGTRFFSCGHRACPRAEFSFMNQIEVTFNFYDDNNKAAWEVAVRDKFNINPSDLEYVTVEYPGQIWYAGCQPCTRGFEWKGVPRLKAQTSMNYYSGTAAELYQLYTRDATNEALKQAMIKEANRYFDCRGPCPQNWDSRTSFTWTLSDSNGFASYMQEKYGATPNDYEFTRTIDLTVSGQQCLQGACPNLYTGKWSGFPQMKSHWPTNPQPDMLSFIAESKQLADAMLILSTDHGNLEAVGDETATIAEAVEGLVFQLFTANDIIGSMKGYEETMEKIASAELAKQKAAESLLSTFLSIGLGILLGFLIPGVGAFLAAGARVLTTLRLAVASSRVGAQILQRMGPIMNNIRTWGQNVGNTMTRMGRDVFQKLPNFLQNGIRRVKPHIDDMMKTIRCVAEEVAEELLFSLVLPDFGNLVDDSSTLTRRDFMLDPSWSNFTQPQIVTLRPTPTKPRPIPQLRPRGPADNLRKRKPTTTIQPTTKKAKPASTSPAPQPTNADGKTCFFYASDRSHLTKSTYKHGCAANPGYFYHRLTGTGSTVPARPKGGTPYNVYKNSLKSVDPPTKGPFENIDKYDERSQDALELEYKKYKTNRLETFQCDHTWELGEARSVFGIEAFAVGGAEESKKKVDFDELCKRLQTCDAKLTDQVRNVLNGIGLQDAADTYKNYNMHFIRTSMNQIKKIFLGRVWHNLVKFNDGDLGLPDITSWKMEEIWYTLQYLESAQYVATRTKTYLAVVAVLKASAKSMASNAACGDLPSMIEGMADRIPLVAEWTLAQARLAMRAVLKAGGLDDKDINGKGSTTNTDDNKKTKNGGSFDETKKFKPGDFSQFPELGPSGSNICKRQTGSCSRAVFSTPQPTADARNAPNRDNVRKNVDSC
ncbi:hypothetical protein HK097_003418 [Rhizophlyctis rosea]|uniref:GH18 domain-containing protein n=1 Tax=Rhizophlyctis rosea TaxID=64517 RepID=A0AAD5X3U6_9FUNG|nr:hypothetical protein HK097_003418 [Rhizophlyctis rosea]